MKHIGCILLLFCAVQVFAQIQFPYVQHGSTIDEKHTTFEIYNPSKETVRIQFKLGNHLWFSKADILESVENSDGISLAGIPIEVTKAWEFVMRNTVHIGEISLNKAYTYHAQTLLNSFGGGFCSHRNTLLAQIWEWQGYKSRLINLEGHVVPEVKLEDQWVMFDADCNYYFCNSSGGVAGVTDIQSNYDNLKIHLLPGVQSLMNAFSINTNYYKDLFISIPDNFEDNYYKKNIPTCDIYFELPGDSDLNISSCQVSSVSPYHDGTFLIKGNYTGFIRIPFAVYSSNADITQVNFLSGFKQDEINPPGLYFLSGKDISLSFLCNPISTEKLFGQAVIIRKDKDIQLQILGSKQYPSPNPYLSFREKICSIMAGNNYQPVNPSELPDEFPIENPEEYFTTIEMYYDSPVSDTIIARADFFFKSNNIRSIEIFSDPSTFINSSIIFQTFSRDELSEYFSKNPIFLLFSGSN